MKINCIVIDDEKISRLVIEKYIKKTKILNLVKTYESAIEAVNSIDEIKDIDLIFLDVEMPEMTGIEFIQHFPNLPRVIIVSAQEKYAINAIEYDVTDYILKPVNYARFVKAVERVKLSMDKDLATESNENDSLLIKETNSSYKRIKFEDILWVEALENYIMVVTAKTKYTIHFTMKSFENKLPANNFMRIHRSYIINYKKIDAIEDNEVIIIKNKTKKKFPIAKAYKDALMTKLNFISK